jgi:hypothetical protein
MKCINEIIRLHFAQDLAQKVRQMQVKCEQYIFQQDILLEVERVVEMYHKHGLYNLYRGWTKGLTNATKPYEIWIKFYQFLHTFLLFLYWIFLPYGKCVFF